MAKPIKQSGAGRGKGKGKQRGKGKSTKPKKKVKPVQPETDRTRIKEFRKLTAEKIKSRTDTEHERVGRALEAADYEGRGEE